MDTQLTTRSIRKIDLQHLLSLALLALGVFMLLPHLIGFRRTLEILRLADARFLVLALIAETLRYVASAGSTIALARLFDRRVPLAPMTEAFFAGAALNRTFSTGGAPGMIVRLLFLMRQGVSGGSVAVIYLIENVWGLLIGGSVFLIGILVLGGVPTLHLSASRIVWGFVIVTLTTVIAALFVIHYHARAERAVLGITQAVNAIFRRLFHRTLITLKQAKRALDDFYAGVELAQSKPLYAGLSFLMNVLRNASGYAALYCAFLALGSTASLPGLILFYTAGSILSTVSAVPGEMLIIGTGYALLSLAHGIPTDLALIAILLSRTVTFWFPLPVGYAALWHLHREKYV